MNVSDLRGLSDPSAMFKPHPPIVSNRILSIFSQSTEHQKASYRRPSPALACIAIHNHYIINIL